MERPTACSLWFHVNFIMLTDFGKRMDFINFIIVIKPLHKGDSTKADKYKSGEETKKTDGNDEMESNGGWNDGHELHIPSDLIESLYKQLH